ncbi:MAG TPA: alpha/beta hydrolase family protein [Anaerolineales bacterium]|nr:alpha/beta hydrolase family protein [Anaerolineales bacterium]
MILSQVSFFSDILTLRCTMNVILPQRNISNPQARVLPPFRVLYLLHGHSDDHTAWQRWTSIERYVEGLNLAVIMPAVHNSFYTDMAHGGKYFTFMTAELPEVVHGLFPLSTERADTFVAGLSMGGYGAFKLALSRPDLYAAAASLSGAVDICEVVKGHGDPNDRAWSEAMSNVFGDLGKVKDSPHDLFRLATDVAKAGTKPRLFQFCGVDDFLYTDNIRFRDFVKPLGFDYTYLEGPGDHTWGYWDAAIQKVLAWLELK